MRPTLHTAKRASQTAAVMALALLLPLASGAHAQPAPVAKATPAAPAPVQRGIGARMVTAATFDALPKTDFALLFMFGEDAQNRLICERFLRMYSVSLGDKKQYQKFVYLPITAEPPPGATCAQAIEKYDQQFTTSLYRFTKLYLDRLPRERSVFLMLISHSPSGEMYNKGYIIFTGATGGSIDAQLRLFNQYYEQSSSCWRPDEIRPAGNLEKLWDTAMFLAPDCPIR